MSDVCYQSFNRFSFFLLIIRDPVLYLEHVGGDGLQLSGDGELRLDGDVDHGVVPAGLTQG